MSYKSIFTQLEIPKHKPHQPEVTLITFVIERAVRDAIGFCEIYNRQGAWKNEAWQWLESKEYFPFSASWCFEAIEINQSRFVAQLKENIYNNNYEYNRYIRRQNKRIPKE